MSVHVTLPAVLFMIGAVVALGVATVLWPRRPMPGARNLIALELATTWWALAASLEAAVSDAPAKLLFSQLSYLGVVSAPVLFLIFALRYTRPGRPIGSARLVLLWVVPAVALGLAASNGRHGLIWTSITPSPIPGTFIYEHGAGFYVMIAYLYAVSLAAAVVLGRALVRLRHVYRWQALAILLAVPLPLLANVLYVAGASPIRYYDTAPAAFAVSGLAFAVGIYFFGLFDIVPVAHDRVIDSMGDGVVVVDLQRRVVEFNPAARRLLADAAPMRVGDPARPPLSGWLDVAGTAVAAVRREEALAGGRTVVDLSVASLTARSGRATGWLVILHDITQATRAQRDLSVAQAALAGRVRELEDALAQIKTLQGLLPICSYCKRIRTDGDYWQQLEGYISEHSGARFSHGVCPDCYAKNVQPQLDALAGGSGPDETRR